MLSPCERSFGDFWVLVVLQTWILKVSIHCEGCRKKVKKVLQSMEGVYKTTVDPQQHKVVVTGNVDAEILIKKLLKAGKHAELWPEKKPTEDGLRGGAGSSNSKKNKNKNGDKPNKPSESVDNNQISPATHVPSHASHKPEGEASKNGGKKSTPPPEKKDGGKAPITGDGGKKKEKGGQNGNNNSSSDSNNKNKNGTAEAEVAPQEASKKAAPGGGAIPPAAFNFPVYTTPQVPSYLVSYSSMQPTMSYGGACYSAPLPILQNSCVYSAASPGSYYNFGEETANACGIM
ncbi:Heavy-metal-associated domain [Musa troglodytarum]|uniref:Heavy-metal-associated domain n=1 Tax=Musa troglodytarum TaxID=320322 RepID=A0A9E7KXU7_9LILI|nr:Heavy-metal-associated domain [Musa troglodytarum]